MDAAGECFVYDELINYVFLADSLSALIRHKRTNTGELIMNDIEQSQRLMTIPRDQG
jgi:hypothetical protein